jgi:hypothetical protein
MRHNAFDLDLPDWGPYGKEYIGLSHIADPLAGDRWDCFIMPAYHRRAVIGPYGKRENRWHFWRTAPDLSSYTLRYELEWKDHVYVDVTYAGAGDGRYAYVECVNHSSLPQNVDIHFAASLSRNPKRPSTVDCPAGGVWVGAQDYEEIIFPDAGHRRQQMVDGLKPGSWSQPGAVDAACIGASHFFQNVGEALVYTFDIKERFKDGILVLRYHRWTQTSCKLRLSGFGRNDVLELNCDGTPMTQLELPIADVATGSHSLRLELTEGRELILEGLAVLPKEGADAFKIHPAGASDEAKVQKESDHFLLSYRGLDHVYQVFPDETCPIRLGHIRGDDVPAILSENANDSVHNRWTGLGDRSTCILSCGPVSLAPRESHTLVFRIGLASGCVHEVKPFSRNFAASKPYAFGMELLAATTLANVVYPTAHRSGFVRHNAPGRLWDSLYTWDSGMLGLGLSSLDLDRAKDCLHQYLLPKDDPYAGFIEHGTPLPTQAELAWEIWEQSHDMGWLNAVYPKLTNFYEWLAGRTRGSTTDRFKSRLLQTWDYSYNSGGWDDYPPQHTLRKDPERRSRIAPCVTTAYAIRFARHLKVFAAVLRNEQDVHVFAEDMRRWSQALEWAWDEESGYYAYLEHDLNGNIVGPYRHDSGENYNCGFDGIIPFITGTLSEERSRRLLGKFFNPNELWTQWGGTTVSQSAAYYSDSGYWNGAVWMPHNYMMWKALRESGHYREAKALAEALLGCWEREAKASYHSFELFRANTGRGAGWHQFAGLSSVLLPIFKSEYLSDT